MLRSEAASGVRFMALTNYLTLLSWEPLETLQRVRTGRISLGARICRMMEWSLKRSMPGVECEPGEFAGFIVLHPPAGVSF